MTNPPDPSATYDLYLQLRKLGEQHGYWPGTDVVDIVSNWLKAQGLDTDPHHEITGQAWIYGREELRLDGSDPFLKGFALSDTWGPHVV